MVPPRTRGCTQYGGPGYRARRGSPAHAGMHPRPRGPRAARCRFPRARGDAPELFTVRPYAYGVPPRTRGCTRADVGHGDLVSGSPAHAGMHPGSASRGRPPARFPRARGDAPAFALVGAELEEVPPRTRGCTFPRVVYFGVQMVPPRTRGCTVTAIGFGATEDGSPAHAGMHPSMSRATTDALRFPRARGDAPSSISSALTDPRVPPRTRGCTLRRGFLPHLLGGSPAHAGMHPIPRRSPSASCRFPRARGDAPDAITGPMDLLGVPPRTRGCTQFPEARSDDDKGSPAHAGMHPAASTAGEPGARFPRARGDAPFGFQHGLMISSVPPRTRGCTQLRAGLSRAVPGSPAHAGMHPGAGTGAGVGIWFPRARGDAPTTRQADLVFIEVPPRTRGCTREEHQVQQVRLGSPAHAGMHPSSS